MRSRGVAATGGSWLEEVVRDGARAILAAALQAELEAFADEVDEEGHRFGRGNGVHPEITTWGTLKPVRLNRHGPCHHPEE